MAASANDLIKKVGASTVTTLAAPGKALSATSITVGSTTNWPTDTGVTFAIRVVDADGALVAGTYTEWKGTVTSGTTIAFNATPEYGSDQVYAAGSTTQVFIPLSSSAHNDLVDALIAEHDQLDGTHTDITATSITATTGTFTNLSITGTASSEGWSPLGATPDTVTANGNKSYDLVFNSNDLTDTITPGMRLRTARTVAAPIQSTSLNGTTQYYSKSSPNKMTFTDDFVCSAWVKLTSYAQGGIVSRYNGSSGWAFLVNADGTVSLRGYNAASGNYSQVSSYQSLPLNKWVHVASQLDMSGYPTVGATNSYVMFDGVDVPAVMSRAGTNPTALIQAGNLVVGDRADTAPVSPFPGKLAQVAVYSAKVTQATILASIDRTLTGSETSLASAYSFSNSITDLNTTTPNDLTANGSAVATNNDSPFGNSGVSTTLDYAIVMAASFSTNTTLTVQVPEGCTIPSSGGVSTVDYSTQNVPYGFPRQKGKWRIQSLFRVQATTGANTTFGSYNGGGDTITVPVGEWIFGADMPIFSGSVNPCEFALTADAITGTAFGGWLKLEEIYRIQASAAATYFNTCTRRYPISVSVATKYTLYQGASSSVSGAAGIDSDNQLHQFVAENAYV